MKLAVDMSSIMWTCLNAGKDVMAKTVEYEGEKFSFNTASFGYEHVVNHLVAVLNQFALTPMDMIMVFEGGNSNSRRIHIDPEYKAKRGLRPPEAYEEFQELHSQLATVFGSLGALSLAQERAEGDDTLAWLAQNTEEDLVIDSYDCDLAVLVGRNQYGANVHVHRKGSVDVNPYGDWPCKYIRLYKALVGDQRDNISGIKGFGPGSWDKLIELIGPAGIQQLYRMLEQDNLTDLYDDEEHPLLGKLVKGEVQMITSWQLASLHPEWVNTFDYPLQFRPGLIKGGVADERLAHWSQKSRLVTASNKAVALPWVLEKAREGQFVALDIETSTPAASDEWLASQSSDAEEGVSKAVDVIGSELTGMSLTFGNNMQYTVYIPVDHKDSDNLAVADIQQLLEEIVATNLPIVIHNFSFEGAVFGQMFRSAWMDNGRFGLLPKALDTKLEASYVNENISMGLKKLSKYWFNYDQVDYATVTTVDGVQLKMNELTAAHVKDYGCDDTIVTASLHNFFKLFMQLEHTWQTYLKVEIDAMYMHTSSFINGLKCDVSKLQELAAIDAITQAEAAVKVDSYLIAHGWDGALPPVVTAPEPAQIKAAYAVVAGSPLQTSVRMLPKLVAEIRAAGQELFAAAVEQAGASGDWTGVNKLVAMNFTAKPEFNPGSPKQMQKLMYEVMGLPVRVRNKPTAAMKAKRLEGSPKTDETAMKLALALDVADTAEAVEVKATIDALRLVKLVETRNGLFYSTYPYFVHWKTGKIHSSHNQCATNTRRASSSRPNLQQLPKRAKLEGQPARFREVVLPHKRQAVIVSMDFASQELRVIADYSKDPGMVSCFVGDNPRDMHTITAVGVAKHLFPDVEWTYDLINLARKDKTHEHYASACKARELAKTTNFGSEYGALAPKMAQTLLVSEAAAQVFLDAKEAAFSVASAWKKKVVKQVHKTGFVRTKMGAVRHLRDALCSDDYSTASKAERQSVNTLIQGSSAEMTKMAEGRMFRAGLEQRYDARIIGPIHDEVVASVTVADLVPFCKEMHACMVASFADMTIPVESSISFGPSFGVQIEIGSEPTEEAINKGLAEMQKYLDQQKEAA